MSISIGLLQRTIERRLSAALGARQRIAELRLSPLAGSIDAHGISLAGAGDGADPFLTIDHLKAEIAVGKALRREITVKSIAIERPVLSIHRRADGSTNLPRREDPPASSGNDRPACERAVESAEEPAWRFDLERLLMVGGEIALRCEATDEAPYRLLARPVLAEVRHDGSDVSVTVIAESVTRRQDAGADVEVGQVKATGTFDGVLDFSALLARPVRAQVDIGETVQMTFASDALRGGCIGADVKGSIDLQTLLALVPNCLPLVVRGLTGLVQVAARLERAPQQGVRVTNLSVESAEVAAQQVVTPVLAPE